MLLEMAIAEVQQIIGWRSDKVTEITRALAYSQTEREKPGKTYPWWLKASSIIPTVAGVAAYVLPANYIQDSEERDGNVYIYTGAVQFSRTIFLKKRSFEDAQQAFFGVWPGASGDITNQGAVEPNGVPREYVLANSGIRFYPVPNAVYNVFWVYWAKDSAQAIGQENAWLREAPWILIGEAAQKLASDLQNKDAAAVAAAILEKAEQNLFRSVIHREEAGRRRSMGSRL